MIRPFLKIVLIILVPLFAVFGQTSIVIKNAIIVDGSEVTHPKPHPEAYLLTASKLAVEPRRCAVFEDSTVGVRAAKNAGMYCVAVRNPNAKSVQDLGPADVVVDSFEALLTR